MFMYQFVNATLTHISTASAAKTLEYLSEYIDGAVLPSPRCRKKKKGQSAIKSAIMSNSRYLFLTSASLKSRIAAQR